MLTIRRDDVTGQATRDLIALHVAGMHANSPPGHCFPLDLSGYTSPDVTLWTAWAGDAIAGMGALRDLGDGSGEIKSMRTHPDHLGKRVGAAILETIITEARARGYWRLSLETGSGPAFEAALSLYRKRGFLRGGAFSDYVASDFNQFFHLELT
jgi:putative acetyltransferase